MKVALVGPFPPQHKGEAEYLQRSAEALVSFLPLEDIEVVSQYETQPSVEHLNGLLVRRAIFDRTKRPSYAPQHELPRAVIESGADIVHVHFGPNQDYGGRLGEPLVGALRTLRRRGIKIVLTLHSQWKPNDVIRSAPALRFPAFVRPLIVRYFGRFMRRLRASCDAFLCVVSTPHSPLVTEFAHAYGLHDVGEELFSCAIDFSPVPQNAEPLIFSFGFLRPEKGFEVLIEAFLKHRNRGGAGKLLIAGAPLGDEDRRYARMLRTFAAGHASIEVLESYLADEDIAWHLRSCSVFVLPYLRAIGSSAPLHKALGFGRPIIASAVGHNATLGSAVNLVPPASSDALANELSRLLAIPGALEDAAERARAAAIERSAERVASEQYQLYTRLLSSSANDGGNQRVN